MTPLVEALEALAFHRAPVSEANPAIDAARALRASSAGDGTSYEVALPAALADDFLKHKVLPKLVYFLDCRGVRPPASGGVFVSLFAPCGLSFIDAGDFAVCVGAAAGLDAQALRARYADNGSGDPLLLPGAES